jgi:hypothetical protein
MMRRLIMGAGAAMALGLVSPVRAAAQGEAVVIVGLGGEQKYRDEFRDMGTRLSQALVERYGVAAASVAWLGEDSTHASPTYRGLSTRENIVRALSAAAGRMKAGESLMIFLIGHGGGEGNDSKLSIPGPDMTASEYDAALRQFAQQRVAFVNLSSGSGDMVAVVSGPNRVVITATKTALERNESVFGRFFVDAIAGTGADTDKDGRVSLFEAYAYADTETARFYENEAKIRTEHAQLDDNADGKGTAAPTGRTGDGMLARRFFLDAGPAARLAATDPALARLYTEKYALEEQVDQLRARKATMDEDTYYGELEQLLLSLSRTAREIRRMEGR